MAKSVAVWGIDIGRCALKALRCRMDGDAIVADGFDYIEYPKLLTQPEADAPQLIKEALEQFLSRNTLKDDRVAISVSGESGLARYFKPPPVDVKKIADIVKYEAKQQIPFALEDVIWDFQRLPGGQEVDGFALDTEIGLFAMKREQVAKALQPYDVAEIEVDVIQLAPISIYNYVAYDIAKELPEGQDYDSESPPPSMVVLSIGTDTTDLVVTNGYRVWQRNIPLGGNHFTKQLSKELKLTFAKAEHLKRNPRSAEDPKTIFQAMRPVFADMVTEVQRSIGFFQSLDRKAKIVSVVMLGNTCKLPGLTQYLSKHLGYEVKEIESFNKLSGASVVTSPSFKDNILGFATCYGLCLQGLNKSKLSTNLLPREILTERMIRAKKPWAVAGVSAVVLGLALSYAFYFNVWNQVHPQKEVDGTTWDSAVSQAKTVSQHSQTLLGEDQKKIADLKLLQKIGQEVVGTSDRRVLWLELMKAINQALPPMDPTLTITRPGDPPPDPSKLPFVKRQDLKIEYIESQFYPDLAVWFTGPVKTKYADLQRDLMGGQTPAADPAAQPPAGATTPPAAGPAAQPAASAAPVEGPKGPGWVIEIRGYHFFNGSDLADRRFAGPAHLKRTFLNNLVHGTVEVPLGPGQPTAFFTYKELGIDYPILALDGLIRDTKIPNPNYEGAGGNTPGGGGFGQPMDFGGGNKTEVKEDPNNPEFYTVPKYDFVVQFCWQEKPLTVRIEERLKAQEAAAAAAANAPQTPPPVTTPPATTTTPPATTPAAGIPAAAPATPAPAGSAPSVPGPGAPAAATPAASPAAAGAAPAGAAPPAVNEPAGAVPAPAAPVADAPAPAAAPAPPQVPEPAAGPPAASPTVPPVPENP